MRYWKKTLCAALAATMILMGTSCNVLLEPESPETVTFRFKGFGGRLIKMCEDRITITFTPQGWTVEGLRKDAFRIASGLEYRLTHQQEA